MANQRTWMLVSRTTGVFAAGAANKVSAVAWKAFTGKTPPRSATDPDIKLAEALTWAIVAGALSELTRVAINRGVYQYWVNSQQGTKKHNRDK